MRSVSYGFRRFLGIPQFRDDLGPTAFRPFLLGNSIVGTVKRGLATITAWLEAIASNLCKVGWHYTLSKRTRFILPFDGGRRRRLALMYSTYSLVGRANLRLGIYCR